jgi:hypothetical protein
MFYPFSPPVIKDHEQYLPVSFMEGSFSLFSPILSPLFQFANGIKLTLSKVQTAPPSLG